MFSAARVSFSLSPTLSRKLLAKPSRPGAEDFVELLLPSIVAVVSCDRTPILSITF